MKARPTAWQGLELLEERTLLSCDGLLPVASAMQDDLSQIHADVAQFEALLEAGPMDATTVVLEGTHGSGDDLFGDAVPWIEDDAPGQSVAASRSRGHAAVAGDGDVQSSGRTVQVDGELAPAGGGLVLGPGDVLSGSGTVHGDVSGDGTLRPGNSPGKQTITGNFTPGEGAVTEIDVWGMGQGTSTGYDWIEVGGTAAPNGTLKILFQPQGGYVPALGDTFDILTWGSRPAGQVFDNWLGTASIPGQPGWALKPTYLADRLRLTLVQTPAMAAGLDVVLLDGIQKLGDAANFLDGAGKFAQSIPFVGSNLGSLADTGTAIVNGLKNRLSSVFSLFPRASQVVATIEGWNNTTFGGFTVGVNGVLATYGTLSTDPMWWDVNLELRPTAATLALQNVAGSVFGAIFNGS